MHVNRTPATGGAQPTTHGAPAQSGSDGGSAVTGGVLFVASAAGIPNAMGRGQCGGNVTHRLFMSGAVAALAGCVWVAAVAFAPPVRAQTSGSIVYILDGNVWLASPDGAQTRHITTDGTVDDPYRDPTQSDDGMIFAFRGHASMNEFGHDGESLAPAITLAALDNGTEGLAASPDGSRVAFDTTGTGTLVDPRWGTPSGSFLYGGTDVANADGTPVEGGIGATLLYPDWVDEDRLVASDGVDLYTYAIGQDVATRWVSFSDGCATDFDCPKV